MKDGVVLATEKLITAKLLVAGANKRIGNIDYNCGMTTSGLVADGRELQNRAREDARSYRDQYDTEITGKALAEKVGLYMQAHTLYSSVRPFGISALIAAMDKNGPSLYLVEPSGEFVGYFGCAIGKGKQNAKTEIEKLKLSEMTVADAVKEAARIIYKVHDDAKDKEFELELSWIGPQSNNRHQFVPQNILDECIEYAKASLEESMED